MSRATTELVLAELGREIVVTVDDDGFRDYRRDESGVRGDPDVVVLAETREQIATVLRLAGEHQLFVTPRGAGSGKAGGCVAVQGGIVLSTERMQRIIELDPMDMVAVVEPGVITEDLANAADEQGLYYPPDPASLGYSSLGGNIAANAGGPSAFKYGVTGSYVLGVRAGLIGGESVRVGRRTAKGVSGFDLVSGFVGSEGTFGVLTEATLRLIPRPNERCTLLATFESRHAAGEAVTAVVTSGLWPSTLELIDGPTLKLVEDQVQRAFPPGAGAALLIELDGDDTVATMERCGGILEREGATHVIVAPSESESRSLWQARRGISPALKAQFPHKVSEDICVPRGKLPAMLGRIDDLARATGIEMAAYGHAGDGNLHVNFLFAEALDDERHMNLERALESLFRTTIELGGTLSAEHGIGAAKRRFMSIEHDEQSLEWQRRLKAMWDPKGLMNPGKVIPERLSE